MSDDVIDKEYKRKNRMQSGLPIIIVDVNNKKESKRESELARRKKKKLK